MSGDFMLDDIIMNLFKDTTEQQEISVTPPHKIMDDKIYFYQGYLQDYSRKKAINDTNKILRTHNYTKTIWGNIWMVCYL